MNVREIIKTLQELQIIAEIPKEHHSYRNYERYSKHISNLTPIFLDTERGVDEIETMAWLPGIENYIWIPDGDLIDYPVIDEKDFEETTFGQGHGSGTDALAWYRSFHWYSNDRWGIYILDSGIYYLAKKVFSSIKQQTATGKPYNTLDYLQQSFKLLFLHEFYHFLTDIAATTLEIGSLRISPQHYYKNYVEQVYLKPKNIEDPLEEALANAFAYRKFKGTLIKKSIRTFMELQHNGYRAFYQYAGRGNKQGEMRLASCISEGRNVMYGREPLRLIFNGHPKDVSFWDVPLYIVPTITIPRYAIKFVTTIPSSSVIKSPRFEKDLRKLSPEIQRKCADTLGLVSTNLQGKGIHFEKLIGCDTVFTIRITRNYRLSLRPVSGQWELLRIGTHDDLYRNPM